MTNACKLLIGMLVTLALAAPAHDARAEGNATFGTQWWDQNHNEALYQQFRVIPRGGFLESFLLRDQTGPYRWLIAGANATRDDQAYRFGMRRSAWRLDLGYTDIPHLYSQVAVSPYAWVAPGVLALPDTLQRGNQEGPGGATYARTMNDLLNNSPRVPLSLQTAYSSARLRGRPFEGWRFDVNARRIQRSGQKPYAGIFGFSSAIELPEPIEQVTTDVDATADWQRSRVKVRASAGMSRFDNALSALRFDNPQRYTNATTGAAVGQLALPPDNSVLRGSVALGVDLPQRTVFTASVGMAQNKQNQDYLPLTTNTAIAARDSLPAKSADAKAVILNLDARLATYAVPNLHGTLRVNLHDYDDQSPERTFVGQVAYDQSFNGTDVVKAAESNKELIGGLDVDWQLGRWGTLSGLVEHRGRERTHREVEKDAELVYGGSLRLHATDAIELGARYKHGDRELDKFLDDDYKNAGGVFIEQPGLRRFDVANRQRDDAGGSISVTWGDRFMGSLDYGYLKNDYADTPIGLQDDTQHLVATEGSLELNDRWSLNGGYTFGQVETHQLSRESAGATLVTASDTTDWTADLKDRSYSYFATVDWEASKGKVVLTAGYEATRAFGEYDLANFKKTAQDLPSTYQLRQDVLLNGRWQASRTLALEFRYAFEQYEVEDFSSKNIPLVFPLTGSVTAIYLGDSLQDYKAHRLALAAHYSF